MFYSLLFMLSNAAVAADPALSLLNSWGDDYKATNYALEAVANQRQVQAVNRLPPSIVSLVPTVGLAERQLRGIMGSGSLNDQFVSIRELTSGQLAEAQLSRHMLLPAPSWLGTRSYLDSFTDKEKIEIIERNLYNMADILVPSNTTSFFRLRPEFSKIVVETGNRGNGNGKVDAGEWVQLSVALSSISRQPAYSTSAWVSSRSACAWVKERDEIVVPEFRNEQSAISFWVYISEDCPAGKAVPFTISIEDTWVNPKRPESLNFGVRVESAPVMSGIVRRIDGDTPGWSREQNTTRLVPSSRYELRVDAQLTGTAMAGMDFVTPTVSGGISVLPDSYVFSPMVRSAATFIASDDLDFQTPDLQQGTKWLKAMDRPWAENPDPRAMYGANVYALTINDWFDEPQIKRQYFYRQEFILPFTRDAAKAPPPPPPPKSVAVKPPPPPVSEKPVAWTVVSLGVVSFNAVKIEEQSIEEEEFFDSGEAVESVEVSEPGRFFQPAFRLHVGKQVRGQLDASFGTIDENVRMFSFTAGPRVNVVNMDRVQVGTFAGLGVRSIFESLQSDVQTITRGGISADILLSDGFLVWGQTSFATKTPEDDSIGYAILSNHLSFGIGGRF